MRQHDTNYMFEKDAIEKMCPIDKKNCIASKCMSWKWAVSFNEAYYNNPSEAGYCGMTYNK